MRFQPLTAASSLMAVQHAMLVHSRPMTSLNPNTLSRLSKRALDDISCGDFSTASRPDTWTNIRNLRDAGGLARADAGSCSRLGCYNNSGIYLCNDQDEELTLDMDAVMDIAEGLYLICIPSTAGSGQASDATGWNVAVGYCNGDDSPSVPPTGYTPPGPNGDPDATCSGDDCSGIECDESSIVVQSQEVVTCDAYLGPRYTGAGNNLDYSTSRLIGTTWTVGGSLSINLGALSGPVGAAGFQASYSESVTVGTSSGTSGPCGEEGVDGDWVCGIEVQPQCYRMIGTCSTYITEEDGQRQHYGTSYWENTVPITGEGDDQSVFYQSLCVCPNCASWADEGAPDTVCNIDCTTCDPNDRGD